MRSRIYRIILLTQFVLLLCGLFYTQVLRGGAFYNLSLKNTIRLIPEEPFRGRIYDRNGNCLADNMLSFDVMVIPQELKDKHIVFKRLAEILSISAEDIERKYERGFLNPFTPVFIVGGLQKTTAITLEEEGLDLPGIVVAMNSKRFYPRATTASHVLGYLGEIDKSRITKLKDYGYDIKDKMGYSGVEERLDIYLRGEKGGRQIEVDNRGRQVRLLGYKPPLAGRDVMLTIDLELQEVADKILQDKKGAVIIMDVTNGEIIVLSSAPAFDPNVFVDRKDKKAINYFLNSEDAPLFNRAISGQFPPGSIFKVVTATAAFKTKKIQPPTSYLCTGKLKVGNRFFKCWSEHGWQDFYQAMGHSCDVYFYEMGLLAGPDGLTATAHEFGLGALTGIDLRGEATGFIPSRLWKRLVKFEGWYNGDTANFSIGQGFVLTTPLQLAFLMASVANGGYLVEPHVTKNVGDAQVDYQKPKKIKIVPEYLDLVRKSLAFPVRLEDGTADVLNIEGLQVCAKTGTAQVTGKESHGWVAGFFPENNPRYAFCILLENVGSSHYACTLGKELLEEGMRRKKF